MTSTTLSRNGHREMTFEDLKGLRAEGYIRESSLDQRDGFGPDIQRHSIERFAESYGLVLGGRWYAEFLSGARSRSAGSSNSSSMTPVWTPTTCSS